ncbi:MAG TPA: KamA family radical SAM protein [Spirochaetia bacterium]|nr:KamA family radical SAM protein [Spirochaetia bacterium]
MDEGRGAAPAADFGSWQEQLANSIRTEGELEAFIRLTPAERDGIRLAGARYRWGITPYYAGLMDPIDPTCPIRRQVIPSIEELSDDAGTADPIGEEAGSVTPTLIRLYPDRVAWRVSGVCSAYCRFCFRRRLASDPPEDFSERALQTALDWIGTTPEIRDVLITGGDPFLLGDDRLRDLLGRLRAIEHVEVIRIGTRTPVTLPHRITGQLCEMLRAFHPLWINTHFNHPKELTPLAISACARLADAGIPLGNQSVLLRGVNDDEPTMRRLVHGLVKARIRPYYLFQCHLNRGTAHFRTSVEQGRDIVGALRGSTSGFAVPTFVVDTPYGKVPIQPQTILGREGDAILLRAWDGRVWREPNRAPGSEPDARDAQGRPDA